MRYATKNGTTQNWIESNNLRVWIREGGRGISKSSSDDRPGPCICGSKYVEDAKAARSVRVWDRVPMKNKTEGGKSSLG